MSNALVYLKLLNIYVSITYCAINSNYCSETALRQLLKLLYHAGKLMSSSCNEINDHFRSMDVELKTYDAKTKNKWLYVDSSLVFTICTCYR